MAGEPLEEKPQCEECEEVSWGGHEANDGGSTLRNLQCLKEFKQPLRSD